MWIARYAAQELKADFLKQASRSAVACEYFSVNLSQAERAEGIAGDHMRGGGADALAPRGTPDHDSNLCTTLRFGNVRQSDCPHAPCRSLWHNRPSNTCLLAKLLAVALKPVNTHFD